MRFQNFLGAQFLHFLFLAGLISLTTTASAQDGHANQKQDGVGNKGFGELLDLSLKNELEAIASRTDKTHVNTWQGFSQQMHLRGRAGQPQQIRMIADAILAKHEVRNRERTVTRLDSFVQEYETPVSNTKGLASLIQKGELDRVFAVLESQTRIEPEIDLLHGVKRTDVNRDALMADPFWLACKLAAAYHRDQNVEAAVSTMNLARKIFEGDTYTGAAFDADNDWLPEPSTDGGVTLGSYQQFSDTSRTDNALTLALDFKSSRFPRR